MNTPKTSIAQNRQGLLTSKEKNTRKSLPKRGSQNFWHLMIRKAYDFWYMKKGVSPKIFMFAKMQTYKV